MHPQPLHRALGLALGLALFALAGQAQAGVIQDESTTGWCRTTAEPATILSTEDARLEWQADGHLVLYRNGGGVMWSTGLTGQNLQLCFQGDGNLVIYDNGAFLWSTGTSAGAGSRLHLDRCSISVRDADGVTLWDTPARCDPINSAEIQQGWCRSTAEAAILLRTDDAYLAWQGDGNLALYDAAGVNRWSSGTAGRGDQVCFQNDGNLAIYDNGQPIWDTASQGGMGTRLVLDGCALTLFGGSSIWTTGFACTETHHDEIGTGWCRNAAQSGVILQTEDTTLNWQSDGHLALYDRDGNFRWGSGTSGADKRLCFQDDGNLVIYSNDQAVWSTGTVGGIGSRLALDNCNLSVLANGQSLWNGGYTCAGSANTDRIGKGWCRTTAQPGTVLQTPYATLSWQADGNLALYDRIDGSHQWSTGTANAADRLCFQDDGNLVIYDAQNASIFATHVYGAQGPTLSLKGCTLSIDGQPWSVGFDCDVSGGVVQQHTNSNAWTDSGFGGRYTAAIAYQQPYDGLSRTYGEATADVQTFNHWTQVAKADAWTIYSNGATSGRGTITLLGTLTVVDITTEDTDLMPPIEGTIFDEVNGLRLAGQGFGATGTTKGRIRLTGRLNPTRSGASVTVTPSFDLRTEFDGGASALCLGVGIEGTVYNMDVSAPYTAGIDFLRRTARLKSDVEFVPAYGTVKTYQSTCVKTFRQTLADLGSEENMSQTNVADVTIDL